MSKTPKKRGPKPQGLQPYTALLTEAQVKLIHDQGPRQGNQFIRDVIDFTVAHYSLFLTWVATRS